ncbi:MAG: DUF4364 family protein [Clostridia bacterium]|nr:DUF4364 family protein [Clostridia bacterium]
MERDAISANVSKGGLKNTTEIKILVLYLLMNISEPLPASQIANLIHLNGIANTFEITDAFEQLSQSGLIDEPDEFPNCFVINENGRDAGQTLQSRVPFTIREKSLTIAKKMLERNRHIKETEITIDRTEDGIFLTCSALENGKKVMSFTLQTADDDMALHMKENFLDDPALFYRTLFDMLTK